MSPSLSERISKYREEEARRSALIKQQQEEAKRKRITAVKAANRDRLIAEELDRAARQNVLRESGVVDLLREAERNITGFQPHRVVISPDRTGATLVWGKKFKIESDGTIVYDKGPFGLAQGEVDYKAIEVGTYLNGTVQVNDRFIAEDEWRKDPQALIDTVAECFISPRWIQGKDKPPHYDPPSEYGSW